ncbi:MAG: polysaccharide deacetylase family protein [Thermoanaerobacteraceae bacterium]|nr:polysaccharide deacetylase family protein [Thermoanaerobacteraceae bacterium]
MRTLAFFLVVGLLLVGFTGCSSIQHQKGAYAVESPGDQEFQGPRGNLRKGNTRTIVLVYHNIVADASKAAGSSLTVKEFAEQMAYLYANNYQTLGLEELLTYYNGQSFPEKSVMLTFDDGYQSFYTLAYPVLKKYGFRATIFPIVGMTPGLERQIIWNEHLTFHELRTMIKESGLIDIGSHTYDLHYYREDGHPAIQRQNGESEEDYIYRITKDLRVSKDILELQTDQRVTALAWPYGLTNQTAVQIAKELGYRFLFTLQQQPLTPDTPLDRIPRYGVSSGSIKSFKEILSKGGVVN